MNKREIIDALQTIQKVCEEFVDTSGGCKKCPFYVPQVHECGVTDVSPCNWGITNEDEIWRAMF